MLQAIKLRYMQNEIYTYSGIVLIAANPFARVDSLYEEPTHTILAWKGLARGRGTRLEFDPATVDGFPADTRIVDFRPLQWADDGSAVFFGIKEWERKAQPAATLAKAAEDSTAADSTATWSNVLFCGSMVVSQSCIGFISPRPLKRPMLALPLALRRVRVSCSSRSL